MFLLLLSGVAILGMSISPEVDAQPDPQARPLLLAQTKRPLTPQQRQDEQQAIQDLETQANTALAAGNLDQAFELWEGALRLRRGLDPLGEIEALGRVGQVALRNNRTEDLQRIRQRLDSIATQPDLTSAQLQALAQAYEAIDIPQSAALAYRRFLRQGNLDLSRQQTLLRKIATLHLAGFHYTEAAQAYTEWLGLQGASGVTPDTVGGWEQLAYIYDRSQQPQEAIAVKTELLAYYQRQELGREVAQLQIAIAQDYQTLNQAETASQYYQAAFNTAWELQQFDNAEIALDSLAGLYYQYGELDYALQVYQELIKVQQNSYDYYGLMNTYDQMGTILRQQGNTPAALAVYEEALDIARSLHYREGYFQAQIETLVD